MRWLVFLIRYKQNLIFNLRLLYYWVARLKSAKDIFTHQIGRLEVVQREGFILSHCKDKSVVHIGFLDSPFTREKYVNGEMLHTKIKEVCNTLLGIDVDEKRLAEYKDLSGDQNILKAYIHEKMDITLPRADVFVLGEVIEHVDNPVDFLKGVKLFCSNKTKLIITIPNALNPDLYFPASLGFEVVHPEHLYWFSPVTVSKVLDRAGFRVEFLGAYNWRPDLEGQIRNAGCGVLSNGLVVVAVVDDRLN